MPTDGAVFDQSATKANLKRGGERIATLGSAFRIVEWVMPFLGAAVPAACAP